MKTLSGAILTLIVSLSAFAQQNFLEMPQGSILIYKVESDGLFEVLNRETTLAVELMRGVPFIRDFKVYDGSLKGELCCHHSFRDIASTSWDEKQGVLRVAVKGLESNPYVFNLRTGQFAKQHRIIGTLRTFDASVHVLTPMTFVMNTVVDPARLKFVRSPNKEFNLEQGWNVTHDRVENRPMSYEGTYLAIETTENPRVSRLKFGWKPILVWHHEVRILIPPVYRGQEIPEAREKTYDDVRRLSPEPFRLYQAETNLPAGGPFEHVISTFAYDSAYLTAPTLEGPTNSYFSVRDNATARVGLRCEELFQIARAR